MVPPELFPLQSLQPLTETLLVLVATVLSGVAIWYLSPRLKPQYGSENVEAGRAVLILLLTSGATVLVVVRWEMTENAVSVVRILEVGTGDVVRLLLMVILFVAAYTSTRVLKRLLLGNGNRGRGLWSEHQRRVSFYFSQVVIYVVAVFLALFFWQVDLGQLLLSAGILGIVLGFAAQETLGSILAGFILMLSRPFDVGHWIVIGDHEGFVTEITINNVTIRNLDGEHVVLPNEYVQSETIVNRSLEGKLRVRLQVGVDYDVEPEHAEAVVLAAIEPLEEIMSQPAPQVIPVEFGDSAVVLELHFWIDDPTPQRRWQARLVVIHAVKRALDEAGIKIPFPQRELSGRDETGGFRVLESESSQRSDPDRPPAPTGRR